MYENETEEQTGRMGRPSAMATSLEGSYRQIDTQDGRVHEWRGSVTEQEESVTTCNREIWRLLLGVIIIGMESKMGRHINYYTIKYFRTEHYHQLDKAAIP